MSHNLLKGKRGIIFGALNDMSIAWKVAERAVEEGATITLSNTPIAVRMGQVDALAEKLNAQVIPADATSVEDLETVFAKSVEILGGKIDFVLHSIGMSPNVRKKRTMIWTMECWKRRWISPLSLSTRCYRLPRNKTLSPRMVP